MYVYTYTINYEAKCSSYMQPAEKSQLFLNADTETM